jgi:predicted Zn-dependent peptidase
MADMLKDVTFKDSIGTHPQYRVRCMRRGSKYRDSEFGILNVYTNTFVLFEDGRTRQQMLEVLKTVTFAQYEKWAQMKSEQLTASRA